MAKGISVSDLRDKSDEELADLVKSTMKELFTARFENHTHQLNDTANIRSLRRQLARIYTLQTQRKAKAESAQKAKA
jgi:large subunit ribosomal protein L29